MATTYDGGQKLRAICELIVREKFAGSVRAWATAAGMGDTTIAKVINGKTDSPGLKVLTDMAAGSGYTVSQLIGETPLVAVVPPALPPDQALTRIAAEFRRKAAGHSAVVEEMMSEVSALIAALKARE